MKIFILGLHPRELSKASESRPWSGATTKPHLNVKETKMTKYTAL